MTSTTFKFWLTLTLLLAAIVSFGKDVDSTKRGRALVLPIAYYTPETKWAFGGGGICYYNFGKSRKTTRPSSFYFYGVYTTQNQVLFHLPFHVFTPNDDVYIFGQLAYFNFPIDYYGIGNGIDFETHQPLQQRFSRQRFSFTKRVEGSLYLGVKLWSDIYFDIDGSLVDGYDMLALPGKNGGQANGAGLVILSDTRKNVYCPPDGHFVSASIAVYPNFLGTGGFLNAMLDLRKYVSVGAKNTFAFQYYGSFNTGDVPFFMLEQMGGPFMQRGYYRGSLRDRNQMSVQAEWRRQLIGRFGGVLFAGFGGVFDNARDLGWKNTCHSIGLGLRVMINRKERIPMRIDHGIGQGSHGWYGTTGEAF